MIKLKSQKYELDLHAAQQIKDKVTEETCKTNVNPQLIFKQSYTGYTLKTFVGNWTPNGFWLSKYRKQLFQLRPDVIAKFRFEQEADKIHLSVRYSIGFSSVFTGLVIIFLFSTAFLSLGATAYLVVLVAMTALYVLLAFVELGRLEQAVKDKIL
ncbi:hypothetical protein [Maribellus sp. YY47]|uniref:hypothetical protein n=1 Tax=Maribellus sp. YY47 TaxID=2929486 RepID=UPI0020013BF0|nr:hypothetical protein [Maribellus sp. YY47]MCK3685278.1 hypothetical protein [Maribellus sp. YY47]